MKHLPRRCIKLDAATRVNMESQRTPVCPRSFLRTCRAILVSTASYPRDVVQTARKWVARAPAKAPQRIRDYLGVAVGAAVNSIVDDIPQRIENYGEQLVQNDRIDRIVREWVLGSANADDYTEVGWALRLRDRFGFPSPSEAARQSGERWVLKQLQGVDAEEWQAVRDIPIDGPNCLFRGYDAPGQMAQIAAVASTLWLTPTASDKALARHQGFRVTR